MRILVIGAGAVGGYLGARLAEAGRDVSFLVRPGRAQQLRDNGLRIISPHGETTLKPTLISADDIDTPYDLILLGVKAYALDAAITDFAPAVGDATMIVPVLNGMRHIDRLVQHFGEAPVLGGVCVLATQLNDAGAIVQIADIAQLRYGERDGVLTDRIRAADAVLQGARFDARIAPDIVQAMWEKWVQLASLGAATCLLRSAIGEIVAAPGGAQVALRILAECAAVARACGHPAAEQFLSRQATALTTPGSGLTSSMYRDLRVGAQVEADHIIGDLLERGRAAGVETPLLDAAFVALRVYQATLPAAPLISGA
jgi:2-dehydropantoate 2-reductase